MATEITVQHKGKYFSCPEAAERLGLDADTVRRYCNCDPPRLKAKKFGRDWMILGSEIDRYNRERKDVGRPPS